MYVMGTTKFAFNLIIYIQALFAPSIALHPIYTPIQLSIIVYLLWLLLGPADGVDASLSVLDGCDHLPMNDDDLLDDQTRVRSHSD